MREETTRSNKLKLSDFCDMTEFEKILSDWTITSHMSVVVMNTDNDYITKKHGFSNYCQLIQTSADGENACHYCHEEGGNIFLCHAGLCDFSLPVVLPDGQIIATVICGQVKLPNSTNPDFNEIGEIYRLDSEKLKTEYESIKIKSEEEIEAAKSLLSAAVNSFVEKNYEKWLKENEIRDERTLSQITQMLYAYNVTLELETGKYTLITGTGMNRTVTVFKQYSDFETAMQENMRYVHPGYQDHLNDVLSLENLKVLAWRSGHIDTIEYPVLYPDDESYEWHEINIFADQNSEGEPVINILGRDVTEAHDLQEKSNREIKAAAARNQILSDLTKMLYSYNLTLNLNSGKYSLIEGTGMVKSREILKSTDFYRTAYDQIIKTILPENFEQFAAIASAEALKSQRNSHGFIGSLEYGANVDNVEEWHEINVFISADELGNPLANILGRDITEAHKRQEQREIAQKAAAARDQLLSGVTKMLYSFNITVNLNTWKYTLITGTGCGSALKVLQQSDDYVLSFNKIRRMAEEESKALIDDLCGAAALNRNRDKFGFIGTITTSALFKGRQFWQEINLFMGTNEYGEPIANILGRDITAQHERTDIKPSRLL